METHNDLEGVVQQTVPHNIFKNFILGMVRASWGNTPEFIGRRIVPIVLERGYKIPKEEIEVPPDPMRQWRKKLDERIGRSRSYFIGQAAFYTYTVGSTIAFIYELVK